MPIRVPSILDRQRSGVEIGRIRLGAKVSTANGGSRPSKLAEFRLTSPSRGAIAAAADMLGGEIRPWKSPTGPQFEVYTTADSLDVVIPPGEPIEQNMEMWSGGGCVRRCPGGPDEYGNPAINQIDGKPCACPAEDDRRIAMAANGNACKPTTRLRVMLPALPGIGVWRVESHGFYAAVELVGRHSLLKAAAEAGVYVPAKLRLEQRQRGKNQYGVPVLDIGVSVAQIAAGEGVGALPAVVSGRALAALPAARPPERPALPSAPSSGPASGTPAAPRKEEASASERAQTYADKIQATGDLALARQVAVWVGKAELGDQLVTLLDSDELVPLHTVIASRLEELTPAGAA